MFFLYTGGAEFSRRAAPPGRSCFVVLVVLLRHPCHLEDCSILAHHLGTEQLPSKLALPAWGCQLVNVCGRTFPIRTVLGWCAGFCLASDEQVQRLQVGGVTHLSMHQPASQQKVGKLCKSRTPTPRPERAGKVTNTFLQVRSHVAQTFHMLLYMYVCQRGQTLSKVARIKDDKPMFTLNRCYLTIECTTLDTCMIMNTLQIM